MRERKTHTPEKNFVFEKAEVALFKRNNIIVLDASSLRAASSIHDRKGEKQDA